MTKISFLAGLAGLAALTACAPAPVSQTVSQGATSTVQDPLATQSTDGLPVTGVSGLETREPDLCHAKDWVAYLGQSGSVVPSLDLGRPYRVVQWRGIEPQDYNPQRIVFRLDASSNIYNIDCG